MHEGVAHSGEVIVDVRVVRVALKLKKGKQKRHMTQTHPPHSTRTHTLNTYVFALDEALDALLEVRGLQRKLEVRVELRDQLRVLQLLARLHDAHDRSVDLILPVLEHALRDLGGELGGVVVCA